MISFLINEIKKLGAAQSEDKTFILVTFGSAGARIGHKLYTVTRAQGIPLDWGLVITGNSVEEKSLVESGVPQDCIIKLLNEGASREIELGCEKIEERKTEIIEKIKRFLNKPNAIIMVVGGYAGGVSGACSRKEILEDIAQYSNADSIFYFAIASHKDADDMVMKNEACEFDNLTHRTSKDPRFNRISVLFAQNRFHNRDYSNSVIVKEALLPLLKSLSRPDGSGEQRLKKQYLTGVVGTIATAEEAEVKSDKQSLNKLVDYAARNNFIQAPDPRGMFEHIVALIQLPAAEITDGVRQALREEIAARFDIPQKSVDVFGAPEDRTNVTRLVLLCCGIKDGTQKFRKSGLFKMLKKSRNTEMEELEEWKRRTRDSFYNANHTDGEDKKSEEED